MICIWSTVYYPKLKFCPITSVDVERSFPLYKNVLTDRRQSFLTENLEMYLIVIVLILHNEDCKKHITYEVERITHAAA